MNFAMYFLLFMMYSVIGWITETIYVTIRSKKFVNRGFLLGPYCPIYGFGGMLVSILLVKYMDSPLVMFGMSIIIFSILEYFTSYILEKIFKTRWWDYSKRKYNINGRICLETMIPFGILGMFVMYLVNPILLKFVYSIPDNLLNVLSIIILIIFIIDNIISFEVVTKFVKDGKASLKDETVEIKNFAKQLLRSNSIFRKRLVNAFPNLKRKIGNLKERLEKDN